MVVVRNTNLRIVTAERLKAQRLAQRKDKVIRLGEQGKLTEAQVRYAVDKFERGEIPAAEMSERFDPKKHVTTSTSTPGAVAEFTGASAGQFAKGFFTRLSYEVQNGRDEVPLLFEEIYNVIRDENIQETETIYTMSGDDVGVVFEEILPGGEVSWANVGGGQKSIYQRQWAKGLEYTKRFFKFGRFWQLAQIEREFGKAANAVQNHIHFDPILTHNYTGDGKSNQTDGGSLTGAFQFRADARIAEKYHRTLGAAISNARQGSGAAHRPGPYALLISNGDLMTVRSALENPEQRGVQIINPEVIDSITSIIAYRGWSGTSGNEEVSYSGVTTGKAYLIDLSQAMYDFQSLYSQELQRADDDGDIARFVMARIVWDMFFGVYAAPERAVEEITWPGPADGQA